MNSACHFVIGDSIYTFPRIHCSHIHSCVLIGTYENAYKSITWERYIIVCITHDRYSLLCYIYMYVCMYIDWSFFDVYKIGSITRQSNVLLKIKLLAWCLCLLFSSDACVLIGYVLLDLWSKSTPDHNNVNLMASFRMGKWKLWHLILTVRHSVRSCCNVWCVISQELGIEMIDREEKWIQFIWSKLEEKFNIWAQLSRLCQTWQKQCLTCSFFKKWCLRPWELHVHHSTVR